MRVTLAEDSVLFRRGLARLLGDAGFEVVDEVGNAEDLFGRVKINPPDVAIVDIRMPPTHTTEGIDAAIRLRAEQPDVNVLVLSNYIETEYAVALLEDVDGGVGYLLKDRVTDPAHLVDAITRVANGETVLDPEVVRRLVDRRRGNRPSTPSRLENATSSRPWPADCRIKRSARRST
jgi:DNA-binding NarL/FixJ family response regulator